MTHADLPALVCCAGPSRTEPRTANRKPQTRGHEPPMPTTNHRPTTASVYQQSSTHNGALPTAVQHNNIEINTNTKTHENPTEKQGKAIPTEKKQNKKRKMNEDQ